MTKLTDLLGSYDNLKDTPGLLNHPQNILAITILFMVRVKMAFVSVRSDLRLLTRPTILSPQYYAGSHMDHCPISPLHARLHRTLARMG